jgi:hypothetical protein
LYATTDIKAGTELFFHYNYPEETTKHFKQPKSKVVAIKQMVKQPSKVKLRRGGSPTHSSAGEHIDRPRPRNYEALAIARAAKAAKRAAMLAEKSLQNTSTSSGPGLKQARKSAVSGPISRHDKLHKSDSRGRTKKLRDFETAEASNASNSAIEADTFTNARELSLVVQDTDEEVDDFVLDSMREGPTEASDTEEYDLGLTAGHQTNPDLSHSPHRPRARISKSASVVAVKKTKSKVGGARPGAGRKRKRPLVLNSDDE